MSTVAKTVRFLGYYVKVNWQGAMEFRASFLTQMITMMINNGVWIAFWGIYFTQFPVVNGWELRDILLLWGITAGGYGWAVALCGNSLRMANMIATGQVDLYLTMPKNVLLHMLISRMSFSAWGDYLFSWILFFTVWGFSFTLLGKYVLAQFLVGILFLSVFLIGQSLAFYIGNSEGLSGQIFMAMITFTTYPIDIFHGLTRIFLFVILPAGFVSSLPIAFFRDFTWTFFGQMILAVLIFVVLSVFIFYRGLRKYESGNMITMRM
jgi:ABC-2 type transport system permease protein